MLKGFWSGGTPYTYGNNGFNPGSTDTVKYLFPDLPNDPMGWSAQTINEEISDAAILCPSIKIGSFKQNQSIQIDLAEVMLTSDIDTGLTIFNHYESRLDGFRSQYQELIDGSSSCNYLSTTFNLDEDQIRIFPNPSTDQFTIESNISIEGLYKIYNIMGKELISGVWEHGKVVRISSEWPSGIYLLKLYYNNGDIITKKWIKQ